MSRSTTTPPESRERRHSARTRLDVALRHAARQPRGGVSSLDVAEAVTRRALTDRSLAPAHLDEVTLGGSVPQSADGAARRRALRRSGRVCLALMSHDCESQGSRRGGGAPFSGTIGCQRRSEVRTRCT